MEEANVKNYMHYYTKKEIPYAYNKKGLALLEDKFQTTTAARSRNISRWLNCSTPRNPSLIFQLSITIPNVFFPLFSFLQILFYSAASCVTEHVRLHLHKQSQQPT